MSSYDDMLRQLGGGGGGSAPVAAPPQSTTTTSAPPAATGGYDQLLQQLGGHSGGGGAVQASALGGGGGGGHIGGGGLLSGVKSFLHGVGHAGSELGHMIVNAGPQLVKLGGEAAKDMGATTTHGTTHGIEGLLQNLTIGNTETAPHGAKEQIASLVAPHMFHGKQAGETDDQFLHRAYPGFSGIAHGINQTAGEVRHPSTIIENYKRDPLGALVNDAANISLVASPVAKALGAGAEGGRLASVAGKVAHGSEAVASAPFLPFKAAAGLAGKVGEVAAERVMNNPAGEARPYSSLLQHLDPGYRSFGNTIAEGASREQGAARVQNVIGHNAEAVGVDPKVAVLVHEGEGNALAHLRDQQPQLFDQFINDHYKGSVSQAQAHAAADVASGVNPELAARVHDFASKFDEGVGPNKVGSAETRNAAYVEKNPHQAGFETHPETGAPARLKNMLGTNQAVNALLGEKGLLPETAEEAGHAGADARYFPHTQEGKGITGVSQGGSLPKDRTIGSEKLREGSPVFDRSTKGLVKGFTQGAVKAETMKTIAALRDHPEATSLGEGKLAGVTTMRDAIGKNYVPWDPRTLFGKANVLRSYKDLVANAADDLGGTPGKDIKFIPKPLFDKFQNAHKGDLLGDFGKAYDKTTAAVYKSALHLTPGFAKMWGLQNMGLALTRGEIAPADFIHSLSEAAKAVRGKQFPELGGTLPFDDPGALKFKAGGAAVQKARSFVGGGLPRFLDQMSKTMVAVDKMAKGASREDAIMEANRTMGMFQSASPIERDIIRRVVPIYPWAKHVVTAMSEFAGQHPEAASQLLNTGSQGTQQGLGANPFTAGDLPLGGDKYLDTKELNPLSIVGAPPAGFLNPVLRAGAFAAGLNASHIGTNKSTDVSRPPGQNKGRPTVLQDLHFLQHLNPVGRVIQQNVPGVRNLPVFGHLIADPPGVATYDSGDPKFDAHGRPVPAFVGQSPLSRVLGNPIIREPGASPKQTAKTAKFTKTQSKAAAKYQRARTRSGF